MRPLPSSNGWTNTNPNATAAAWTIAGTAADPSVADSSIRAWAANSPSISPRTSPGFGQT